MGILLRIFQLLGAKFTKDIVVFYLFKVFLTTLLLVAFPIALSMVLTTLYSEIHTRVISFASERVDSVAMSSVIIQVTGLAAFFVNHLNLIASFNVVISAIALRVVLNFVPFSKV